MTDEELIARLRNYGHVGTVLEAADQIEALVKERDRQYDENVNRIHQQTLAENRAERLEAAVAILEDALQEAGDDYPGSSMQQWCQQQVKAARAALKGDDHD